MLLRLKSSLLRLILSEISRTSPHWNLFLFQRQVHLRIIEAFHWIDISLSLPDFNLIRRANLLLVVPSLLLDLLEFLQSCIAHSTWSVLLYLFSSICLRLWSLLLGLRPLRLLLLFLSSHGSCLEGLSIEWLLQLWLGLRWALLLLQFIIKNLDFLLGLLSSLLQFLYSQLLGLYLLF